MNDVFIDSLITHYTIPASAVQNQQELSFWRSRLDPASPGYVNESRYAACLDLRFRYFGEIDSLQKADSILLKADRDLNHHEASLNLALTAHGLAGHRFQQADSFLRIAKQLGLRPYESATASFDVDFELGRYFAARASLNTIRSAGDFGYYFRKSRMDHFEGQLDSAIWDMRRAAELAGMNVYIRGVALSNAGDLYIHAGELAAAGEAYVQCLRANSADFHSLLGLGWIALLHDRNDSLAERIFNWVGTKSAQPDPLFKLAQAAGIRGDTLRQREYARAFVQRVTAPVYGRMYNKYLIQLYTGILQQPELAEILAKDELVNRATPQTYAWYVWTLFANHKKEQAYEIYRQQVSGKPLEALELYWMGRMMEGLNKNYNAREFYKAADATRYDLDPAAAAYIRKKLGE